MFFGATYIDITKIDGKREVCNACDALYAIFCSQKRKSHEIDVLSLQNIQI